MAVLAGGSVMMSEQVLFVLEFEPISIIELRNQAFACVLLFCLIASKTKQNKTKPKTSKCGSCNLETIPYMDFKRV